MKKILIMLLIPFYLFSIELEDKILRNFGDNLFKGNFKENIFNYNYNPNYLINIGDTIDIKLWGRINQELKLNVDIQGNIYIPNVGTLKLLGVKIKDMQELIEQKIFTIYKKDIFVYSNINTFQPINILVTGNVEKPGIYNGMSNDTVLQFLDKAQGISQSGSYRKIELIRNNNIIETFDLYDFLLNGKIEQPQLKAGDTILVKNKKQTISVIGEVQREFVFELNDNKIQLKKFLDLYTNIKENATDIKINRKSKDNSSLFKINKIKDIQDDVFVYSGDAIEVIEEHYSNNIQINIQGEHNNNNTLIVKKGITLEELLKQININDFSDIENIQLFRKNIAINQKELINRNLKELETLILTNSASSTEEAKIQNIEKDSLLKFIEKAKEVEPKGQLVINSKEDYKNIYLEDNDTINIPIKSDIILVQGEVYFPNAYTYINNFKVQDYLKLSGGLNQRSNEERILILAKNGYVKQLNLNTWISNDFIPKKGSSILVLPKIESKNLQITKDITQILYHIAISTGVLLAI